MRGTIIILLLIPAIIALGHDAWLFYNEHLNPGAFSIDLLKNEFKFSALGYIWTAYDETSYRMTVESMAAEDWAKIDKFLTYKAFYVGLAFAGIFIALFSILAMFGIGPFVNEEGSGSKRSKKSEPESFRGGGKSKKLNYKRK